MAHNPQLVARQRSIDFIKKKWGSLRDLPQHVIPVVWVTTYRSMEITMRVEAEGGPHGLLKNKLIGDRQLAPQLEKAALKIEFLGKMISLLRSTPSQRQKSVDSYVLVDFLKWAADRDIDLENMSGTRRMMMRRFAKADPLFKKRPECAATAEAGN
jgi:hypothetical protein